MLYSPKTVLMVLAAIALLAAMGTFVVLTPPVTAAALEQAPEIVKDSGKPRRLRRLPRGPDPKVEGLTPLSGDGTGD